MPATPSSATQVASAASSAPTSSLAVLPAAVRFRTGAAAPGVDSSAFYAQKPRNQASSPISNEPPHFVPQATGETSADVPKRSLPARTAGDAAAQQQSL